MLAIVLKNHFILIKSQPPGKPASCLSTSCVFRVVFIFIVLTSSLFICCFPWLGATPFFSSLSKSTQLIRSIMHLQPTYVFLPLVLLLFPLYQSPHFKYSYCPISLPIFVNWSKSPNNNDRVNCCISVILLFITCWLPIAFLTAAVPNVSAVLKPLIPALLPSFLAHNLTSYWENWNHPNLSLHNFPALSLQKSVHLSLFAFALTSGNYSLCRETRSCPGGVLWVWSRTKLGTLRWHGRTSTSFPISQPQCLHPWNGGDNVYM